MEEEVLGTLWQLEELDKDEEPEPCPQCESTDVEEEDAEHWKCNACGCVWLKTQ